MVKHSLVTTNKSKTPLGMTIVKYDIPGIF